MSLLAELERRNVLRATLLYVGAVWALAQGIAQLAPVVGAPEWAARWFLVAAAIGLPFWLAFAWFYEWTPGGLRRESEIDPADSVAAHASRKLDVAIIGVLAVAVVLLLADRFVLVPRREAALRESLQAKENALARPAAQADIPDIASDPSIAVLPLVNMSSDKEQEYFSDGVSEELLNLLSKVPKLRVIARTSSFSFKGTNTPLQEIAQKLHVAAVLEGSVRKSGNQLRIKVNLIRASDSSELWSQTYDRAFDDIFRIQDEIAGKVVEALKGTLLANAPKSRPTDPGAYALYLQATQLGRQFTAEACAKSDALYRQVLAIDPRYAPAWVGLAINFANEANIGVLSSQEGYGRAREAAREALAIDPDHAPAHSLLGYLATSLDNDLAAAATHYQRALALDPANPSVLLTVSGFLVSLGRIDESQAVLETILRRDPTSVSTRFLLGVVQSFGGRYDAALSSFRTALDLSPGRGIAHYQIGLMLLLGGDARAALAEMQQETSELWRMSGLPLAFHALGRKAESDAALEALIAAHGKDQSFVIAGAYAFRGEIDRAFEWLDKALQEKDSSLPEAALSPLLGRLHQDARWLPFLRRIGQAPEQLAKIEFKVTLPE